MIVPLCALLSDAVDVIRHIKVLRTSVSVVSVLFHVLPKFSHLRDVLKLGGK